MTENILSNKQQTEITEFEIIQNIDPMEFSGLCYHAVGAHIHKNFENQRIKDGKYKECHFEECHFNATGLSGTQFMNCKLENCNIEDSNLQYCNFSEGTKIYGDMKTEIVSSNLSQSSFVNTVLANVALKSTTISQARFLNSRLHNIIFDSCTLQDDIFQNVLMEQVSFIGCNLEYSEFSNIEFHDSILPFHQIAYTYGLLEAVAEQTDQITIGAKSSGRNISGQEYLALLPELLKYYKKMNEYFPAINILIYMGEFKQAEESIYVAIQDYVINNNFRKIKAICKLVANHIYFDKHFMAELYFKILEYYNRIQLSEYEQYQYSLNINEIKQILTGTQRNLPSAQIVLRTNFSSSQIEQVGEFHNVLESCLIENSLSTDDFTIEIRHNSVPLSFWLTVINSNPALIIQAIGDILTTVSGDPSYFVTAINILGNTATVSSLIYQIVQNKKKRIPDNENSISVLPDHIKKNRKLLNKKKIEVSISSAHFNFNYQKKVESGR